MTAVLELERVEVAYGNVVAVRGVDLSVEAGSLVALLGPNGAGKSSLLAAACGLVRPGAGTIRMEGREVTGWSAPRLARAGIRLVPEGRALFPEMSVLENLQVGAGRIPRAEIDTRIEELLELFPALADRRSQRAGTLSGGEQQMLAIARALIARPRILVLDEPSMGLAPKIVGEIVGALGRLRDRGTTILLAEQNARPILPVVDRAVLLSRGMIAREGTVEDLRETIESGYFGADVG